MILIAIEPLEKVLILHASDTYSGYSTSISGVTTDELILRFHPLLASWISFSQAKKVRRKHLETPLQKET